jgi:hypothetical protein
VQLASSCRAASRRARIGGITWEKRGNQEMGPPEAIRSIENMTKTVVDFQNQKLPTQALQESREIPGKTRTK